MQGTAYSPSLRCMRSAMDTGVDLWEFPMTILLGKKQVLLVIASLVVNPSTSLCSIGRAGLSDCTHSRMNVIAETGFFVRHVPAQ